MILHFFKLARRRLVRNGVYSWINIFGLTVGLCASMLIFTYIVNKRSYDKFWSRADSLYEMYAESNQVSGTEKDFFTPEGLGQALMDKFPEVENYAPIYNSQITFRLKENQNEGPTVSTIVSTENILSMLDVQLEDGEKPTYIPGIENLLI